MFSHLESVEKIKPGNEAKIIWANDSVHAPTEYVLLYLHGFSASRREGFPVNEDFPKRYGCNAYLARLASHGLDTDNPLIDMTPFRLYESAKQALAIARQLGQKVIIMGTSTGGTLALKLAADFPEMVNGLILYSPNIRIKQKASVYYLNPGDCRLEEQILAENSELQRRILQAKSAGIGIAVTGLKRRYIFSN